jgi:hypothetical protein
MDMVSAGRVRWSRFALLMVPAMLLCVLLVVLTATGSIAASVSVSGNAFVITSTRLVGAGVDQYGSTMTTVDGKREQVVIAAIRRATLADLCESINAGLVTLLLRAGTGGTPVSASDLIVGFDTLSGDTTYGDMSSGQDASTLTDYPGATGAAGAFGQEAASMTIDHMRLHDWLVTAGTFSMPGLSLSIGHTGC